MTNLDGTRCTVDTPHSSSAAILTLPIPFARSARMPAEDGGFEGLSLM
jgi:hypothetical protein